MVAIPLAIDLPARKLQLQTRACVQVLVAQRLVTSDHLSLRESRGMSEMKLRIWGSGVRISSGVLSLSTRLPCKKSPIFTVFARNPRGRHGSFGKPHGESSRE